MKYLLGTIIFLSLFLTRSIYIQAADIIQTPNTSVDDLIDHYAVLYDVSATELTKVLACESNRNTGAYNPKDSDGLPAYGLMQFKKDTFDTYANKIGLLNKNIWDPQQQIEVASYMWSLGEEDQWGCYKKLINKKYPI